jgi:hypothetical protein
MDNYSLTLILQDAEIWCILTGNSIQIYIYGILELFAFIPDYPKAFQKCLMHTGE